MLPIDTDTQLTWKRKVPVALSSVSGIKGKGACAASAACGVTGTPRATAAAGNTNGPGPRAINQSGKFNLLLKRTSVLQEDAFRKMLPKLLADTFATSPIGLRDGTSRFSVPCGGALLGEPVLPSQEIARFDAEPTMTLRARHDETVDETRPTTNAQPLGWVQTYTEGDAGDTSTTPRKRRRAQSLNTSREDTPDTDVIPQGKVSDPRKLFIRIPPLRSLAHPSRNNPARRKSFWRVVGPPKSHTRPTQRLAAPSSYPRVWAGVRHSLISMHVPLLIPSAAEQRRTVGCAPCSCEKRKRCCRGASRIPHTHILWGRKQLSTRMVG